MAVRLTSPELEPRWHEKQGRSCTPVSPHLNGSRVLATPSPPVSALARRLPFHQSVARHRVESVAVYRPTEWPQDQMAHVAEVLAKMGPCRRRRIWAGSGCKRSIDERFTEATPPETLSSDRPVNGQVKSLRAALPPRAALRNGPGRIPIVGDRSCRQPSVTRSGTDALARGIRHLTLQGLRRDSVLISEQASSGPRRFPEFGHRQD